VLVPGHSVHATSGATGLSDGGEAAMTKQWMVLASFCLTSGTLLAQQAAVTPRISEDLLAESSDSRRSGVDFNADHVPCGETSDQDRRIRDRPCVGDQGTPVELLTAHRVNRAVAVVQRHARPAWVKKDSGTRH